MTTFSMEFNPVIRPWVSAVMARGLSSWGKILWPRLALNSLTVAATLKPIKAFHLSQPSTHKALPVPTHAWESSISFVVVALAADE